MTDTQADRPDRVIFTHFLQLCQQQKPAEALTELNKLLTQPTTEHLYAIGRALCEAGDFANALHWLEKAEKPTPEILNLRGSCLSLMGKPELAEPLLYAAAEQQPDAEILTNYAHCLCLQHQYHRALSLYQQVLSLEPNNAENWLNCGRAHWQLNQPTHSLNCFRQAHTRQATPESHYWLARACAATGRGQDAEAHWQQSLEAGYLPAARALGDYYRQLQSTDSALAYFAQLTHQTPDQMVFWHEYALALIEAGSLPAAQQALQQAQTLKPHDLDLQITIACLPLKTGNPHDAINALEQLLRHAPTHAGIWLQLGKAWLQVQKPEQAEQAFQQALKFNPGQAQAWANLGMIAAERNQLERCLECQQLALQQDPSYARAHLNSAHALLKKGDYPAGWREYEWRHLFLPDLMPFPRWTGQPLHDKRLLIITEQGFGDSLQFIRFIPAFQQRFAPQATALWCETPLMPLMQATENDYTPRDKTTRPGEFDYALRLLSLPFYLTSTPENLPQTPYLQAPHPPLNAELEAALKTSAPTIGLVWSSGDGHDTQTKRSLPLTAFRPLFKDFQDCQFLSLQLGSAREQLRQTEAFPLLDCAPWMRDFGVSATLIKRLKLLITVDTALAHLAGALGCPAWVLLPFAADWRWGTNGERTPWYPSLRLFRQPAPGTWEPALATISAALRIALTQEERLGTQARSVTHPDTTASGSKT